MQGLQQGTRMDSMFPNGVLVDVDMGSLKGAVESRGHSYTTEITTDILPDELCTGRDEIMNASQILHFLGLAYTIIFLTTILSLALLTSASVFLRKVLLITNAKISNR